MRERGSESRQMAVERYLSSYNDNNRAREAMIVEASKARDVLAQSHRGFLVGCTVSAVIRKDYGSEILKTYSAGNFTPESKKKPAEAKWCAERVAFKLALAEGGIFIPAIVTVSNKVDRGEGGQVHDVLHPCRECRDLMRHLLKEGILDTESRICNVNDKNSENPTVRETTVGRLLEMYQKDLKSQP